MSKGTINHNALQLLVEAGAVASSKAIADGDIWTLQVYAGDISKTVMAKNSGKPRIWRKLDTLAKYIKELGLSTFEIDVNNYDPSRKSLRRPDSASTLKRTHKEANKVIQRLHLERPVERPKLTATDRAIEIAKEKWEKRRAKILQQENPRAK